MGSPTPSPRAVLDLDPPVPSTRRPLVRALVAASLYPAVLLVSSTMGPFGFSLSLETLLLALLVGGAVLVAFAVALRALRGYRRLAPPSPARTAWTVGVGLLLVPTVATVGRILFALGQVFLW